VILLSSAWPGSSIPHDDGAFRGVLRSVFSYLFYFRAVQTNTNLLELLSMKDGHDQGVTVGGSDAFYVRWLTESCLRYPLFSYCFVPFNGFGWLVGWGWDGMRREGDDVMRDDGMLGTVYEW
jgi:hypothetical protein